MLSYVRFMNDFPVRPIANHWTDVKFSSRSEQKTYVVQTSANVIQRCLLMSTDPGDLVLDPTCGSGTTAYVAEQWGRRWITIDTSRVALALARARIMGARYPYYLLADSEAGRRKEAEVRGELRSGECRVEREEAGANSPLSTQHSSLKQGFVYERVPHITLKSIANNAEIDVIWEDYEQRLAPIREQLSAAAGLEKTLEEWQIPREPPDNWPLSTHPLVTAFWRERIERQKAIDASIAAKADFEYLYDKPYEDKKTVRVAGPFTVESLSPHRVLGLDEDDELIDPVAEPKDGYGEERDFVGMILENLRTAGVQQAHKEDRIDFTALAPWPGDFICAEGRFRVESGEVDSEEGKSGEPDGHASSRSTNHSPLSTTENRAAIFIGPEFGTVSRLDLVEAAREAGDAGFDLLIACAFNYDAHSSELAKLGRIPVLKARMNADLHMAEDLKNTGKGNLFVVFGEPDLEVASEEWLVDSAGGMVAPYEIFKLVSGVGRLAEVHGLDGADLCRFARVSRRREIWDYLTDAASRILDSRQHRRGTGTEHDRGVSTLAWHCARVARGVGDLCGALREAGVHRSPDLRALVERLHRDQQDAERADEIAIHSPLATLHYAQARVQGVDVFHPSTGEVRSDGAEGIACWMIDTDYNQEAFFVRHAYFLGANDPYKALKTTLKAEIDPEAWSSLNSDTSRPFPKPLSGRIAVKVINHLGDEVMKVFRV